jgi:hypothetical protein
MGIDPMNNISIIIRIFFVVTLFQHVTDWLHFFYDLSSLHEEWTSYYACPRTYLKKEFDCPQKPIVK